MCLCISSVYFQAMDRYAVPESEDYEPNSNELVLKNYLHITSDAIMSQVEASELQRAELELEELVDKDQRFTAQDICNFHELWLGDVYPFAGKYRTVNMSKGDFPFAAPNFIPRLMQEFEVNYLSKYTPCHEKDFDHLATVLGSVHAELIIIHPFREGNGRLARLLANLMAMQAGLPQLNYESISQLTNPLGFDNYIKAIQAIFLEKHEPIARVFRQIIKDSVS